MIQFLRNTQSQLQSSQQIFAAGQLIFESDTGQLKIGNGSSIYSALLYIGKFYIYPTSRELLASTIEMNGYSLL